MSLTNRNNNEMSGLLKNLGRVACILLLTLAGCQQETPAPNPAFRPAEDVQSLALKSAVSQAYKQVPQVVEKPRQDYER